VANINIDYLQPGMILNSDVKDINGRLLLGAEAELTEKHLYIFRVWGITEADIKGVTEEDVNDLVTEEVDPVILKEAERELNKIFLHTDQNHPAIKELLRYCALRKVRHVSGEIAS
jgi:hypothetical protein